MRLFEDPRGRKRQYDPHRPPLEKHVVATVAAGSNLLRLNVVDYLRNVIEHPSTTGAGSTAAVGRKMSFLNPLKVINYGPPGISSPLGPHIQAH